VYFTGHLAVWKVRETWSLFNSWVI